MTVEEVLEFYKKKGALAKADYYIKFVGRFILEKMAFFCFIKSARVGLHKLRGVDIGKGVYLGADILIDRVFPDLVHIGDNSSVGDYSVISAHANIPMDTPLRHLYPRKVDPVWIGKGVWMMPHIIITPGVRIGDYSVIATGSVVTKDIPPMVMAAGSPAVPKKDLADKLKSSLSTKEFNHLMKQRSKMGYGLINENLD
ncbi:MAG: acyltransferase [Candidatus Peribacteraceae bacterium]|nr:acyltransferase [Candidatus Peribacteraceae bacterium]